MHREMQSKERWEGKSGGKDEMLLLCPLRNVMRNKKRERKRERRERERGEKEERERERSRACMNIKYLGTLKIVSNYTIIGKITNNIPIFLTYCSG